MDNVILLGAELPGKLSCLCELMGLGASLSVLWASVSCICEMGKLAAPASQGGSKDCVLIEMSLWPLEMVRLLLEAGAAEGRSPVKTPRLLLVAWKQ